MDQNNCSNKIWLLIISLLLIVSGVYVFFNPLSALLTSALFIGVLLIVLGAGYILSFAKGQSYGVFALGILDIFVGILFLTNLAITAVTLPVILGFWILANSIVQLVMAFELRKDPEFPTKPWVIGSCMGLVLSILIFMYPIVGTLTITFLVGFYLIAYGLFELHRFYKCSNKKILEKE